MSSEEKDSATTVGFVGTDEVRWYWADARFIGGEFFVRAGKSNVPGVAIFPLSATCF